MNERGKKKVKEWVHGMTVYGWKMKQFLECLEAFAIRKHFNFDFNLQFYFQKHLDFHFKYLFWFSKWFPSHISISMLRECGGYYKSIWL